MSNEDTKYNGWRNYATWRVQLEVVGDYVSSTVYDDAETTERWGKESSINELADELHEYVEEVVLETPEDKDTLAGAYARAFLDDVDWYEIADHARIEANKALKAFNEDDKLASVE